MKLVMDYHLQERDRRHIYPTDEALLRVESALFAGDYLDGLDDFRQGQFDASDEALLDDIAQGRWHLLKQEAGAFNWGWYHDSSFEYRHASSPIEWQPPEVRQGPVPLNRPQQECVFAKCRSLPRGEFDYPGKAPIVGLHSFGAWGILRTHGVISAGASVLHYVPSAQGSASAVVTRPTMNNLLRGVLSLEMEGAAGSGLRAPRLPGGMNITPAGAAIGVAVGTLALLWANYTEDDEAFYLPDQLAKQEMLNTQVRLVITDLPDGAVLVEGMHAGKLPQSRQVKRLTPTQHEEKLAFDLGDGVTLIWTPIVDGADALGIPALEGIPPSRPGYVHPIGYEDNYHTLVNPMHSPDHRDAILVFPASVGIQPVYIAWSVRYEPGVVTGVGEDVSGIWLAGAGKGIGVPIPTRIADKLRGRRFASFDGFRRAFWKVVGNDPQLASDFDPYSVGRMKLGCGPRSRDSDIAGKLKSFEIHHVEWISNDGDIDNLRVTTPANHIDIHRRK